MQDDIEGMPKKYRQAFDITAQRLLSNLAEMPNKDRFMELRRTGGPALLSLLFEKAQQQGIFRVSASVLEVRAGNLAQFRVHFTLPDDTRYDAEIVHFRLEGKDYYHAEYSPVGQEGHSKTLLMLYLDEDNSWYSESVNSDSDFYQPIGAAIEKHRSGNGASQ